MKKIIANGEFYGPFKSVEVLSDHLLADGATLPFQVIGDYVISDYMNGDKPEKITAPVVPQVVTMAQARKAMILSGVSIANVDAAIDGIADAQEKALAQTDWEYSTTVRRDSDLVISLAPALNLTTEQVDAMFVLAHTI
jgi:hypothetical protein